MATTIRCIALALLLLITRPASAQSDPCAGSLDGVQIVLASGSVITGSVQDAVIQVDGKSIPVRLTLSCTSVSSGAANSARGAEGTPAATAATEATPADSTLAAPAAPAGQSTPAPASESSQVTLVIIAAAAVIAVLVTAGVVLYSKVLLPRNQKKLFKESEDALDQAQDAANRGDFETASRVLAGIEGKPIQGESRRSARFLTAFTHVQQDELDQASLVLNALYRENSSDNEAAYFLAYVYVKKKEYDKALPILEKLEKERQLNVYQARRLLGIVYLVKATKTFNDGKIDAAAGLFEKVRALGDFADQIPADMRNRHVMLGTKALYETDIEEARRQFESLKAAAASATGDDQQNMQVTAALGIALTHWLENPVDHDQIESALIAAAHLLDPDEPLTRPWSAEKIGESLEDKLAALDQEDNASEKDQVGAVLRDIHFLRGINVLNRWRSMEAAEGFEARAEMLNEALERFVCALAHDPQFADVLVVFGLLAFYLSDPGTKRRNDGIASLEEARKQGVRVPDILEILNYIEEMRVKNASATEKYLETLDKYLNDETVRKEVRFELLEQLASFQRIKGLRTRSHLLPTRMIEPTVAEVRKRTELVYARADELVAAHQDDEVVANVRQLSNTLKEEGQKLWDQAQHIQNTEAKLLAETGKHILSE